MIKKTKTIVNSILLAFMCFATSCDNDQGIDQEDTNQDIITQEDTNQDNTDEEELFELNKEVPAGPNSWVVNSLDFDAVVISESGIHNWTSLENIIHSYISTGNGKLHLGFEMKSVDGPSTIEVSVNGDSKTIEVSNTEYETVEVGTFDVTSGYTTIEIQGIEKSGTFIADINNILLGGSSTAAVGYVPTDNYYFGRRGPSVNIFYDTNTSDDVEWFYNEVTIPEGEDVLGSFFMANGHAQGYFGIQANSPTERRVLFSIWSAFSTDDPNQVPEEYRVTEIRRGNDVVVQNFGNEGTGKQSFKNIDWTTETTYKFLLKGAPSDVAGSTDYTAYLYNPTVGEWELIASLRRPQTVTYLTSVHSFLENFYPSTGFMQRQANYSNQWVYTTNNTWIEITNATFGVDATASNGHRFDYAGGTNGNSFFLRNCGFFSDNTNAGSTFSRASSTAPNIDFDALP